MRAADSLSANTFSPHSLGIPGPIVVETVRDMRLGVEFPVQALE